MEGLSAEEGTRVQIEVWVGAVGPWRVLEPLIAHTARQDMREDLQQLKRLLAPLSVLATGRAN